MDLPNLVEIQTKSFKWFKEEGIKEVFNDVYPIVSYQNNSKTPKFTLEFVDCRFEEPKYDEEESKSRDAVYAAPLRATLRLMNHETGESVENEVFFGDFPLMTDSGTFIINGAERVIVSQLVRSPGAYYVPEADKNNKNIFKGQVIPIRGTWLEFETDANNLLKVAVDRKAKMPGTVLLRALGLSTNEEIIDVFGESAYFEATFAKDPTHDTETALREVHAKLRPGEPVPGLNDLNNVLYARFFDPKRYDLAKAGRFKLRKKLGLIERILDRVLAQDIVDVDGNVVMHEGETVRKEDIDKLNAVFSAGAHMHDIKCNEALRSTSRVQMLDVYVDETKEKKMRVIGTDPELTCKYITISDILASYSYMFNLYDIFNSGDLQTEVKLTNMSRKGLLDDIDHLGNRRVRTVGELVQNQFRIGLARMERVISERMQMAEPDSVTPQTLTNIRPLTAAIKEFFSSSQLSAFMDQINPLAELTNKRRLSALGPGGLSRDRAGYEVRDVHESHYGRICPIETPEGPNIGLISTLASYARVNEYGFIETPYRKVNGSIIDDSDIRYLTADEEKNFIIAQANVHTDDDNRITDHEVICRHLGENIMAEPQEIDFIDVSPKQIVSVAAACIPFLENDDATRALMGCNMQRQAVPLLDPHAPYVGTGMEYQAARDSGAAVVAKADGIVTYVDGLKIVVQEEDRERTYKLIKFMASNANTCINQHPIVKVGEKVHMGDVIADGPSMEQGDLALGQNVLVGFMTWNGYNYEDAVIMSERLVKEDVYTSIHIQEYSIECRDTKLGPEEITRDIPNVGDDARSQLDADGIIRVGAEVKEGDILVGKVTPKGQAELSPEEKLLLAIFGEKSREVKDTSLRVPHGGAGIVHDVAVFERAKGDEMQPGVNKIIKVYIIQKRKISEGDKMSGRHGNKGVISKILPIEDMPHLEDGTPLDIMLNPLGVPSRMNIGQVLELHLGYAARQLGGEYFATPAFDGINSDDLKSIMERAGVPADGKQPVISGKTGEYFDNNICVGVMYFIKLCHMVDDKLHARSVGPYSLVTQQPLGGKAQNGGQRFGEMEVWALEAYGAAYTLREMLTVKSDDVVGRVKTYEAIVKDQELPEPGVPESFRVLVKELQALALDVRLLDNEGNEVQMQSIADEDRRDPRRIKDAKPKEEEAPASDTNDNEESQDDMNAADPDMDIDVTFGEDEGFDEDEMFDDDSAEVEEDAE